MPLNLTNISSVAKQAKKWSPKFFDNALTGVGKTSGALSVDSNPIKIAPDVMESHIDRTLIKRTSKSNMITTHYIPLSILTEECEEFMDTLTYPGDDKTEKIAELLDSKKNKIGDLKVRMEPYTMEIQMVPQTSGPDKRIVEVSYHIDFYFTRDDKVKEHVFQSTHYDRAKQDLLSDIVWNAYHYGCNLVWRTYTDNPWVTISDIVNQLLNNNNEWKAEIDPANKPTTMLESYISNYSLYEHICELSEDWQTKIDLIIEKAVDYATSYAKKSQSDRVYNKIVSVFRHIEQYPVPLDKYRDIYAMIQKKLSPDIVRTLCKYNLNLLLSDTLNELSKKKDQLQKFPHPMKPFTGMASKEQKAAIESDEPLIIVQAGAGTGKSTTILNRIDHMVNNGIDSEDITVLSFTNAAANNILLKNPKVHSMTIAKMIDLIYSENFSHLLAPIETVINGIEIAYGKTNTIAEKFRKKLYSVYKNDADGYTALNNFVEENYDRVIEILDKIQMTSLELEIIICYQQIDTLKEPKDVQSKYLIIDEVQDNAIFEFIYTLKYVNKHNESLYIVGDCSQTLYEFRGSNPKALNILEGSGVFMAYSLQINYRSNQEILNFANLLLQKVEANQYARIQLQANSLIPVTEQSFTDKIRFQYLQLAKLKDLGDTLPLVLQKDIKPYIDDKLAAGEQVAILTFTRKDSRRIQDHLRTMYPDKKQASLIPEKIYSSTIFSDFIRKYWNNLKFMPIKNTLQIIYTELQNKLQYLVFDETKVQGMVAHMWKEFYTQNVQMINNWISQVGSGHLKSDEFLEFVKEAMLKYEIRMNGMKQALVSARNEQNKLNQDNANADFLFSTIHSAKGLEFENVILLYREESMMAEDKKRMYYVALTRAIKSEYIIAYGTSPSPKIKDDYDTIVETLHKTHPRKKSNVTTVLPSGSTPLMPSKKDDKTSKDIIEPDGSVSVDMEQTNEMVPVPDNKPAHKTKKKTVKKTG